MFNRAFLLLLHICLQTNRGVASRQIPLHPPHTHTSVEDEWTFQKLPFQKLSSGSHNYSVAIHYCAPSSSVGPRILSCEDSPIGRLVAARWELWVRDEDCQLIFLSVYVLIYVLTHEPSLEMEIYGDRTLWRHLCVLNVHRHNQARYQKQRGEESASEMSRQTCPPSIIV